MPVTLRMFASAREAAGRSSDTFDVERTPTVAAVVAEAVQRYGSEFGAVVEISRIWLNGDDPPTGPDSQLRDGDEVAILPPVSGGASGAGPTD